MAAPACAGCGTELRAGASFCDQCGMPVAGTPKPPSTLQAPAPGRGDERKRITVLFADLAGSTAMQEALDPELVRRVMGRWSSAMRTAIERHGGLIDHFAGDGIVATWGVQMVREDDAVRALTAAWAMRTALAGINEELEPRLGLRLRMRVGLHTGDVVISAEGFIVGDTMNTAARIEQNAPEGEVLIGELTYQLVRDHAAFRAMEPIAAKGKSEPVRVWQLLSMQAPAAGPSLPFVGRRRELDALHATLEAAIAARACRSATLIGSPGVGKSRLVAEFVAGLEGRARVVRASCPAYGDGMTYAPVAELVRGLAFIDDADDVSERLLATMGPDDERGPRVAAGLAGILGAGPQTPSQETFWALRTLLERCAIDAPLVVVLDDLHWAEPQFLDLIEDLEARLADAAILLVLVARPELHDRRESLGGGGRRNLIAVGLLDDAESQRLVEELLDGGTLPPEMLQVASGNPLFLAELVRMLIDTGSVTRDGDGWSVSDIVKPAVPPTISALMAARLQQLSQTERAVVERAAVVGREFSRAPLAALAPASVVTHLDRHLEQLRRKELVDTEGATWIDEPVYAFHHVLIRDTAYDSLLKETRATLHERYASWLDARAPELVGETEELVAFHLEQAHGYRRAVNDSEDTVRRLGDAAAERLASAGRRALVRDDFVAAEKLLGRALACASEPDALVRFDRCTALLGAGDFAQAQAEVAALEGLAASDAAAAPAAGVAAAATASLQRGLNREDLAGLDRAIAASRSGTPGDTRVLAHALNWKGQFTVLYEGRHAAGQALLEEALTHARSVGDERLVADILTLLALVALWGPLPLADARSRCDVILSRLREQPGSRKMEAQTQCVLGLLAAMQGEVAEAREQLGQARAAFLDLGLTLDVVDSDLFAARAELLNGDAAAAEAHARAALAGPGGLGPSAHSILAQALAAQGAAEALTLAESVLAQIEPSNLRPYVAAAGVRVRSWSAAGRHDAAIAAARQVVDAAEQTDAAVQRAEALHLLADALTAAGDGDAAGARRAALDAYAAKGHTVGVTSMQE